MLRKRQEVIKDEKGEKEYRNTDTSRKEREGRIRNNQPTPAPNHDRNIRNVQRNPGEHRVREGSHVTSFQEAELRKDHSYFQHSKGNGTKRLRNEWIMKNKGEEEKLLI